MPEATSASDSSSSTGVPSNGATSSTQSSQHNVSTATHSGAVDTAGQSSSGAPAGQSESSSSLKIEDVLREYAVKDAEALRRTLGSARGVQQKLSEVAEQKRQAESILSAQQALKQARTAAERRQALKMLTGDDFDDEAYALQVARDAFERQQAEQQMSESERRLAHEKSQMARELEHYKRQEEAARQQAEAAESQRVLENLRTQLSNAALESLKATGLSPQSAPHLVRRMAPMLQRSLELGLELSPQELGSAALNEMKSEYGHMLGTMEGDALLSFLGDDVARRVSQAVIARHRGKSNVTPAQSAPTPQSSSHNGPPIGSTEWWNSKRGW